MAGKRILIAFDGSRGAEKALAFAADYAAAVKGELLVLHVRPEARWSQVPEALRRFAEVERIYTASSDALHALGEQVLEHARGCLPRGHSGKVETLLTFGDPAEEIVRLARDKAVDVVVVGSHGLGALEGLLLGSVSHKVAHLAPVTVAIVR